jgi:hypothetical protein
MFSTRVAIRGATLAALATGLVLIGAPFVQAASAAPSVVSESVSQITASTATLEATIATQPGEEAINQFQLATSPGGLAPEFQCPRGFVHSSLCLMLNGETPFPVQFVKPPGGTVSEKLAGVVTLSPSTTYDYRILAAKTMETLDVWVVEPPVVFGATQSFTTPPNVPPIKRFPKVFDNGVKANTVRKPAIAVGTFTLNNGVLGRLECQNMVAGVTFNETTEGTEKGFDNPSGYGTFNCVAQNPCKVKNIQGEEVEGIYATAESPPLPEHGTEAHSTGITSLPWTGELIERETGIKQVLTKHVKIWVVDPPKTVGVGNCQGVEIQCENAEGTTEKEAGYELAPVWINGSRNGLKPSHDEFPEAVGTEKGGIPPTGRLKCAPGEGGSVGPGKSVIGGLGGGWELITVE